MARKSRKQKKRRTRKKRGGLKPSETIQCEAAGIPGFPPTKCQEYLQNLKNKPVVVQTTAAVKAKPAVEKPTTYMGVEVKPGNEDRVLQQICEKYLKNKKTSNESGSSNIPKIIKEEKVHPKNVNPQPSNNKCKKTCHQSKASGLCTKKPACDSIPGCLLVEKPTTAIGGKPGTPIEICTNWAGKGDMKILAPILGGGRKTRSRRGKRRRRRRKSRRKSRKRRSRRKSKRKRR